MFEPRNKRNRIKKSFDRTRIPARQSRRGLTSLEVMVSAVILLSTATVITSLMFKCGMIWKEVSQARVAVIELSSQLEELTLLDKDAATEKIKQLELSAICKERLPEAKLTGTLSDDNLGVRVQLSLNWKRAVESKPVILSGWLIESESTQ